MNPEEFTSEQKEVLKTWAEMRDSILSETSVLRMENEKLQKINRELAASNTDIETRMIEIRGRIEELRIKESELPLVISKEVSSLQSQKSVLESEITLLRKVVEILTSQKASLTADVSFALSTFEAVKAESSMLEKVVDKVTTVSGLNANKINSLVENLATSLEEIIEVNRKNVFQTNIVIEKVPAMLMEMQKHRLIKNKI